MRVTLRTSTVIIPAILHYLDSFGPEAGPTVGAEINHGINSDRKTSFIESRPAYCAGIIGTLADMGEGDLLISVTGE